MGQQKQNRQNMARRNQDRPNRSLNLKRLLPQIGPGVALGLYLSRILGEVVGFPGWVTAVLIALLLVALAVWALRHVPWARTWPAFLLLPYILYPEVNPSLALAVGAIAILVWLQLSWSFRYKASTVVSGRRSAVIGLVLAFTFGFLAFFPPTAANYKSLLRRWAWPIPLASHFIRYWHMDLHASCQAYLRLIV